MKKQVIAVVGGGIMGITTALELARQEEAQVILFEKEQALGGLSSSFSWNDITWDRYYHVVLSTDTRMLEFLRELGLEHELFWRKTKTGFYGTGQLVSLSSTMDFVTFPFMTLWQKFRMGLGILYSTLLKDPSRLDKIYVRTWLTQVFGRRVYERIWEPLLRSKLGDARERTSAAFIWATITRLYGARDSGDKVEKMGHIHGGYHRILAAAEAHLSQCGVTLHTGEGVVSVTPQETGDFLIETEYKKYVADKVVMTNNCPGILRMVQGRNTHSYWDVMAQVNYLGVVCVLLILKRSLSPYYVINLLDKELPFTGIIEATNVISPGELNGYHLVYLPKYMPSDDAMMSIEDESVASQFVEGVKKVFPDLQDEDISHILVFRERCVQPLQELYSMERRLQVLTPIRGLYVTNTAMILNSTLNNNAVITLARHAARQILGDCSES